MSDEKESKNQVDTNTKIATKRDKRTAARFSSLERMKEEAERILKGFHHIQGLPEGRRTTRSSSRNLPATPPPAKKERRYVEEKHEEKTTKETDTEEQKNNEEEGGNGENAERSVADTSGKIESEIAAPAVETGENNLKGTEEKEKKEVDGSELAEHEPQSVDGATLESDTADSTDNNNAGTNQSVDGTTLESDSADNNNAGTNQSIDGTIPESDTADSADNNNAGNADEAHYEPA